MSTPQISRTHSYGSTIKNQDPIVSTPDNQGVIMSTPETQILSRTTPDTVILGEPRKSSTFDVPGQNLRNEFDDDDAAAKDEYLKRKIEYVEKYLDNQKKRYKAEQDARVEEPKRMSFGLPAKKGGRRSKKAQQKHRKKTSKRKSRK